MITSSKCRLVFIHKMVYNANYEPIWYGCFFKCLVWDFLFDIFLPQFIFDSFISLNIIIGRRTLNDSIVDKWVDLLNIFDKCVFLPQSVNVIVLLPIYDVCHFMRWCGDCLFMLLFPSEQQINFCTPFLVYF